MPVDANVAPEVLGPPANLEGIVEDQERKPLPDALVIAWPKGKRGDALAQARTDPEGRFILPGLRPGRWMLLVETGGLGTLETERQVPEDGPAELVVEGRSRDLTGVVTDVLGRPQAKAQVTLGSPGLRWTRTADSDANGLFVVHGLGFGKFTLRAALGQRASTPAVVIFDEATAFRPQHVRLVLQTGVFIEGRTLDDTGKLLAGAAVDVMAMPADDLPISTRSGHDGRYRLGPVAPGKHQLLAHLDGYVLLDAPEPQLGPRTRESFDLRLARTAQVSGRVLDEAGRPILGAQVAAISLIGGRDDLIVIHGALPLAAEAAELPIGRLLRPGGVRSSPTDEHGRFSVVGLSPGRTRIEIQHPDKLQLRREPLLLVPGDTRDMGDLTLVAGATLAGRVLDGQEQAVEGAMVEVRLASRAARPAMRSVTDGKGHFFFRLALGEYLLTAQTQGQASPAPLPIHVTGAAPSDEVAIHVAPRSPVDKAGARDGSSAVPASGP